MYENVERRAMRTSGNCPLYVCIRNCEIVCQPRRIQRDRHHSLSNHVRYRSAIARRSASFTNLNCKRLRFVGYDKTDK